VAIISPSGTFVFILITTPTHDKPLKGEHLPHFTDFKKNLYIISNFNEFNIIIIEIKNK
jgi:hypothetical protein